VSTCFSVAVMGFLGQDDVDNKRLGYRLIHRTPPRNNNTTTATTTTNARASRISLPGWRRGGTERCNRPSQSNALPVPIPVLNLTKKSRGRRVPTTASLVAPETEYRSTTTAAAAATPFSSSSSAPSSPSLSLPCARGGGKERRGKSGGKWLRTYT
jgi:hypothetical protein